MDPSELARRSLVEVLLLDSPWSPTVAINPLNIATHEAWQHVLGELAAVKAQRLLDPTWTGRVLDQPTARQKMVEVGMPMGVFQMPGLLIRVTVTVALAIADVQLIMSHVDLTETHARAWERIQAILDASRMFNVEPKRFLVEHPSAQDWILRLSSSPEQFRAHQRERVDAKHPDIVKPCLQVLYDALRAEADRQPSSRVSIMVGTAFPISDDYWTMRAQWLQETEEHVARIWPGQALGLPHAPPQDD